MAEPLTTSLYSLGNCAHWLIILASHCISVLSLNTEDNNFASDLNKPALSRILWWAPRFGTSSSRVGGQYNQYARL